MVTAPPPDKLIPKCNLGISLWVLILQRKFQFKAGKIVLAFCWAHVRRDFLAVLTGWPEFTDWALEWVEEIGTPCQRNDQRLALKENASAYAAADGNLRAIGPV